MTFLRSIKKRAFTLVELLVVIAIIGILAAIVMPAVGNALLKGKALKVSTTGRSLYQMLVQKQTDAIYSSTTTFWPIQGATDPEEGLFDNSTDYFKYMVTNGMMNVAFSFFAAPGVPSANGADDFAAKNNAWYITSDAENMPETGPLFMTKNIGETFTKLDDEIPADDNNEFESSDQPFGNKAFIFTTRGGASFALMGDDLKMGNFTNIFVVADSDGTMLDNEILQAGTGD